mgnify:CR=1 FL=1
MGPIAAALGGAKGLATLGSGALAGTLGGIFAPEGQELSAFDTDALYPPAVAENYKALLDSYLNLALSEAAKPVTMDTTMAPLPSFSGGGLPFNISAPAMDPARRNPERRTFEAPDVAGAFPGWFPNAGADGAGEGGSPEGDVQSPGGILDPTDLDQAEGAIALLMQQLQQGTRA